MTEEQFNLLLAEIKGIKKDLAEIKENMITKDEGLAVSETLEKIALEVSAEHAAVAEDKAEAGYAILSSLIDGVENRLTDQMNKHTETILDTMKPLSELVQLLVQKDEQQDATLGVFDQRLRKQEETTYLIQRKLKDLGGS